MIKFVLQTVSLCLIYAFSVSFSAFAQSGQSSSVHDVPGWTNVIGAKESWSIIKGVIIKLDHRSVHYYSRPLGSTYSSKSQVNMGNRYVGGGEIYGYRADKNMAIEVRSALIPRVKANNPTGEWDRYVITMRGDNISV